ncbi:hypothetical protein QU967_22540, partial [Escherichia coli]|nr:hypothetical protein [Escherichia coli]MDZ6767550.1 hypothetical protein [Escherichia coli]
TVCVVGKMRDLILQLSKSSIYSTKPLSIYGMREKLISSSLRGCMRLNIMADVTPRRRLLASQRH